MQQSNVVRNVLSFYWAQAWRYPKHVTGIALSLPVTVFVNNYIPPLIMAGVLNKLNHHDYQPHQVWHSFGPYLIGYIAVALFGGLLWRIVDALNWRLEGNVERHMAQTTYQHLLEQSARFHTDSFVGSLVSQTTKLLSAYVRIADTTMYQVLPMILSVIFTLIIMLPRAPLYSLLLLLFAIFYIISAFFVTKRVRRFGTQHAALESAQTGVVADSLTNVMAIKSFAREDDENQSFAAATNRTFSSLMSMMHASQRQLNFFSATTGALEAAALLVAVISVVSHGANLATAFLIFSYTAAIANQLFTFSNNSLRNYNRALGDASDMVTILQQTPEVQDPVKPAKLVMKQGKITFKDVTFTHDGADDALFQNLTLNIPAGQKVGLVGHSGSGKTTFTRLLLRFSDIDSGAITIDGQNIANVTQGDLHSRIAYVPQEPLLFHRSIRENIAYGNPEAPEKDVVLSAERAHASDFIADLPDGYDTLVGERGVKLSGGQRQRIAIARAMLKDAPVLLLDEATSALDSESEAAIQDALWTLMQGRTAIVIAHRLSTIQKMDRIIVMDNGAIVEEGSHTELLKQNGTYAKLWARQSGGFMED